MKTVNTISAAYRWAVLLRVLVSCVGGYVLTGLVCSVLAQMLALTGWMQRANAVLLTTLTSFVLYTVVVLWAFHVPSVRRVCAVFGGGIALSGLALWALKGLA